MTTRSSSSAAGAWVKRSSAGSCPADGPGPTSWPSSKWWPIAAVSWGALPDVHVVADVPECVEGAGHAVKENDVDVAVPGRRGEGSPRVLSIAAGVGTARLERSLGRGVAVVRASRHARPRRRRCCGDRAGTSAGEADLAWAGRFLARWALARVSEPLLLDGVTALSGSGPAYIFLVAEALIEAGARRSPREVSTALTTQLLAVRPGCWPSRRDPRGLRAQVTSPGGTTRPDFEPGVGRSPLGVPRRGGRRHRPFGCELGAERENFWGAAPFISRVTGVQFGATELGWVQRSHKRLHRSPKRLVMSP